MWCPKDVLKSFCNLLQGGDGTSAKKLDADLDILWASKGGNDDLSKWSKDDFSTGLIPDYIDCKCFAGKPVATNNFGSCVAAKVLPTLFGDHIFPFDDWKKLISVAKLSAEKKLISDPVLWKQK